MQPLDRMEHQLETCTAGDTANTKHRFGSTLARTMQFIRAHEHWETNGQASESTFAGLETLFGNAITRVLFAQPPRQADGQAGGYPFEELLLRRIYSVLDDEKVCA